MSSTRAFPCVVLRSLKVTLRPENLSIEQSQSQLYFPSKHKDV